MISKTQLKELFTHPLALILLHTLGLAFMDFPRWEYLGAFVLLFTYIPKDKTWLLSRLSLLFVLVTASHLDLHWPNPNGQSRYWLNLEIERYSGIFIAILAILFAAVVYGLLFSLFRYWKRGRYPLAASLIVLLGCGWLALLAKPETFSQNLAIAVTLVAARIFWPMSYQLNEIDILKQRPFLDHFGTLFLPWYRGWVSTIILRGYSDVANQMSRNSEEFYQLQKSGVKLIWYSVALALFGKIFDSTCSYFGFDLSGANYRLQSHSRFEAWMLVFLTPTYFFISFAAATNSAVAVARMCGLSVFRSVYRPLEAKSFNDFLNRVYYHYIRILLGFFYYPFWQKLRWVNHRKLRIMLTHTMAIFFGGMCTFVVRSVPYFANQDFTIPIRNLIYTSPYYLLLGLFSGLTATLPVPGWMQSRLATRLKIKGVWFFAMYALCFSFHLSAPARDLSLSWSNFLYLFGF